MIKKIIIKNLKDNSEWSSRSDIYPDSQFESIEAWLEHHKSQKTFGKPDRWERAENGNIEAGFTDTREVPLHEGSEEMVTEYFYPCEYSIEEVDVTAEIQKAKRIANRRSEREFCLSMIDKIADLNMEHLSGPQVGALFTSPQYVAIILALLTGGTETSRDLIAATGPSIYPQVLVDQIIAEFDHVIASRVE